MKKLLTIFMTLALLMAAVFSLSACGEEKNPHTHTPDTAVKENETAASCIKNGSYDKVVYCVDCSVELIRKEKTNTANGHNYKNYICEMCGDKIVASEGLTFISNDNGTCYVSEIGDCTDTNVVIPLTSPDGDIVTSIDDNAFYDCDSIESVVILDSIKSIGEGAFWSCVSLESIEIPDSVVSIGGGAFYGCLKSIVIPGTVKSVGHEALEISTIVYYEGTSEQWNEVAVVNENDIMKGAGVTRYYYSETEPTEIGRF